MRAIPLFLRLTGPKNQMRASQSQDTLGEDAESDESGDVDPLNARISVTACAMNFRPVRHSEWEGKTHIYDDAVSIASSVDYDESVFISESSASAEVLNFGDEIDAVPIPRKKGFLDFSKVRAVSRLSDLIQDSLFDLNDSECVSNLFSGVKRGDRNLCLVKETVVFNDGLQGAESESDNPLGIVLSHTRDSGDEARSGMLYVSKVVEGTQAERKGVRAGTWCLASAGGVSARHLAEDSALLNAKLSQKPLVIVFNIFGLKKPENEDDKAD